MMRTLIIITLLAATTACTSHPNDALVRLPIIERGDAEVNAPRAAPMFEDELGLDRRDESDNQLAMIDDIRAEKALLEKQLAEARARVNSAEKKEMAVIESEQTLHDDLDRLRKMLDEARERERDYQRQVILARLEAIRNKQTALRRELETMPTEKRP